MKIPAIVECIKAQYRQPPDKRISYYIEGEPGIGKSQAAVCAAAELSAEFAEPVGCITLPATIEDPITLSGLPSRDPDNPHLARFLPFADKLPTEGRWILNIDDLPTAPAMVQAGFYSLFLNRRLGSYTLPTGCYVVATGNGQGQRAATNPIPTPLWSRWTRLKAEADLPSWTRWALAQDVRTEIIAYLQFKPGNFMTFDPKEPGPHASPRSWVFASHHLDSDPPGTELENLSGTLGDGIAAELIAFIRVYRSMVTPDEIFLNPEKAPVPEQLDALYAVAGAIAHKVTEQSLRQALTYARRMPKEYEVLFAKLATSRNPVLCTTRAFIDWSEQNADVVL